MAGPRFVDLDTLAKLGSLTTDIIADLAITGAKIDDGAITSVKMAPGAIDSNALGVNSVSADKLNADVFGAGVVPNGTTNAIDLNVDDTTVEVSGDILQVKNLGITVAKINIDANLPFNNKEAIQFRIENLTSDPTPGNAGRLIFRSDTQEVRVDDGTSFTSIGSGGGGGHTIEDEGSSLPQRTNLNFVGSGVTATDDSGNDATVVTILGGGSVSFAEDLFTVVNPANKILTLSNTPTASSERVSWNGLYLRPGASNDYTVSGNQVTLTSGVTLTTSDEVMVAYAF